MLRLASHIHVARSLRTVKCSSNTTRNCTLIKYTKYHTISCYFLNYAPSVTRVNLWFTDGEISGGFPVCVTASSTNSTMTRVSVTIYTWKPHNSLQFLKVQPRTQMQYIAVHSFQTLASTHQATAWRHKARNIMNLRRRENPKSCQKKKKCVWTISYIKSVIKRNSLKQLVLLEIGISCSQQR